MVAGTLRVYGSELSYYTGKLEAYLRYKGIPHERLAMTSHLFRVTVPRATGAAQMPAVELPDGRWMTDTTPIIDWCETTWPAPPVVPNDPEQAFVSRLLEDYADEWLWRPAMHYRWSYEADARRASDHLADEVLADVPAPHWVRRFAIRRRQYRRFVRDDGVTPSTRAHVEDVYLRVLAALQTVVATRPFLLGDVPTLADFGFFGPMFRHFASDPTPAAIMRERAPAVAAWVRRVWTARGGDGCEGLVAGVPDDWGPLLDDVGAAYLPYLCANAEAWRAGRRRFDIALGDVAYQDLPTSRYRVWCLERLQSHAGALPAPAREAVHARLARHGCWEPLWRVDTPSSGHDPEHRAPFGRGIPVFE